MELKIYLLGQFKVCANDLLIELSSRPAQSLLAYLVLNAGVTQRREKLAGLIWPDAAETNARSYLRQALWRIRKSFEGSLLTWENYLQIDDISVTFNDRSNFWLDAARLQEIVVGKPAEDIMKIVSLYRGELLPGFYEDWVVLERDRLQAAYHQKMNALLERLIQARQWNQAIDWAEQWLQSGYAPEPAYRTLMNAHAGLGDQSMVSATYQRCVESLKRELGVEPSLETKCNYERILRGKLDKESVNIPFPEEKQGQLPVFFNEDNQQKIEHPLFVARENELARIETDLNLVLNGQGRVVFITGEAGSGKTALINEFSNRVQVTNPEVVIASGNCNAHTGIGDPYLPFREILELLTGDVEARCAAGAISVEQARKLWNVLPLTAQALSESGPDLIDTLVSGTPLLERLRRCERTSSDLLNQIDGIIKRKATSPQIFSAQQSDLFEQYSRVLGGLARQNPLVLVIDDLQWTDTGSIGLLFHIGRNLSGNRILILGAYRSEGVALGRDGERHPLIPVVNEFQRRFGDISINLNMTRGREFLGAILDSEPNRLESSFRDMLFRQTRGQPLFTLELLRGMQERGDLEKDESGYWIEKPALDWETMPARIEAVIAERIGRLDLPLRSTLQVASVEGDTFTAEVLARVQGKEPGQIMEYLSREIDRKHRLIRAQSIDRIDGQLLSRYRFRHFLIQKFLYNSLDDIERVYLHEQIGNTLEEIYLTGGEFMDDPAIALQLARHFREARITEKAIGYLQAAGEKAVHLSAYQEARVHLTKAMTLLSTMKDSSERKELELSIQIALGMAWMGYPGKEWENACTRALELCRQTENTSQLGRVLGDLAIIHYVRGEYRRALGFAEEALNLKTDPQNPMVVAMGHWIAGYIKFGMGEFETAHNHLHLVLSFYDPDEHHQTSVIAHGVDIGVSAMAYDASCLWCLGFPDQAERLSRKALTLARELDHPFTLGDALSYGGCLYTNMARNVRAFDKYSREMERLSNEKVPAWSSAVIRYRGEVLALTGQFEQGISVMEEGLEVSQSVGIRCNFPGTLRTLARALTMAGQPKQGLLTLNKAFEIIEETEDRLWESDLYRTRAEIHNIQGDPNKAEDCLLKAIEIARNQKGRSWELRATIDLARLWGKMERGKEAREILEKIYGWFTEGFGTRDLMDAKELLETLS